MCEKEFWIILFIKIMWHTYFRPYNICVLKSAGRHWKKAPSFMTCIWKTNKYLSFFFVSFNLSYKGSSSDVFSENTVLLLCDSISSISVLLETNQMFALTNSENINFSSLFFLKL